MMNWETNLTTTIATISVKNSQRTTKPIDHFKTRTFLGCYKRTDLAFSDTPSGKTTRSEWCSVCHSTSRNSVWSLTPLLHSQHLTKLSLHIRWISGTTTLVLLPLSLTMYQNKMIWETTAADHKPLFKSVQSHSLPDPLEAG